MAYGGLNSYIKSLACQIGYFYKNCVICTSKRTIKEPELVQQLMIRFFDPKDVDSIQ